MKDRIHFEPDHERTRWVACMDLLGMKAQIAKSSILAFSTLAQAIEEALERTAQPAKVGTVWFSDTFVFYSEDDGLSSYVSLVSAASWFAHFMVNKRIPLRGAISCGQAYFDTANGLSFGSALVDAHCYGEGQDWIGLVFTPDGASARARVEPIAMNATFLEWDVPFKAGTPIGTQRLAALALGETCCEALRGMRASLKELGLARKYDNSLAFQESAIATLAGPVGIPRDRIMVGLPNRSTYRR